MRKCKELPIKMYQQFLSKQKKEGCLITVQWMPEMKMFQIVSDLNLNITRNLQWCKDVIDELSIVSYDWDEIIAHPERVFYIQGNIR